MAVSDQCDDCGAILTASDAGCPHCSPEAMANAYETQQEIDERSGVEVSDRTKRRRAAGDPYRAMEDQVRGLTRRAKWLDRQLRKCETMTREMDELSPDDIKNIAIAQKQYADENTKVATAASRCASEMAKIMALKSRLVDSLTREEQMTQIVRWAKGLPLPKIQHLISMLEQVYNEQFAYRSSRKAARKSKTLKAVR